MSGKTFAFVGTVNREMEGGPPAHGSGISVFAFDEENGSLSLQSTFAGVDNPSFLAVDAERRRLYAVTEWPGRNEGVVVALEIDPESGALSYINMQPSLGSVSCHVSFDRTGTLLFVANYTIVEAGARPGQAIAVYPLRRDGSIAPAIASAAHEGEGAVLPVEARSHAHSATISPDNRHVLVADLGLDRVMSYRVPPVDGKLELASAPFVDLPKGSGPRHLVFNADGSIVYVINELLSTMAVMDYDAATGGLSLRQILSTLPEGTTEPSYCAELALSPDGRFLYGTNRGHNSVVRYSVAADGSLTSPAWVSCGGVWPRNLTFDPSGKFVIVANQHSDSISVFRQEPASGDLIDTAQTVSHGTPMRVVFARF